MSGIYGIFRFDGAPVERETLALMRSAMTYYGPDGGGEWCDGGIGLGHLLLKVTPEDSFEVQPIKSENISLVTYARLDNRDELLRKLMVPLQEWQSIPDSKLVMQAYLLWGERCPDHLNGDWQFAAWDTRQQKLFVARDHHGNTALYYHRSSKFIAFASSQKAILALPDVPHRPDMINIAQILTAWSGEGWRTSHEGIQRLPPAHSMRVTVSDLQVNCYWFPENLPCLAYSNEQDYLDEFLEIYTHAVRVRLRSAKPVGVTLSGGLDSGSVAALAGPMLAAEGKDFTAFTSVPHYKSSITGANRLIDEWSMATATSQKIGNNILHQPIRAENVGIVEGIKRQLALQDAPTHGASNMFWIHAMLEQFRNRGVGTILTGQCGNGTVSFAGNGQSLPLLMRGQWHEALQTLLFCDKSIYYGIKLQILKPMLMSAIRFVRALKAETNSPWNAYSAINPVFARNIRLQEMMRQAGYDPTFSSLSLKKAQLVILDIGNSGVGSVWHEIGAGYGVEVRDPTVDRHVIEYCLRLPNKQFRWKGESRLLIRRSMSGRMPEQVLNNKHRGLQSADIVQRVLNEIESFESTIKLLEQSFLASDCLDIAKMKKMLKSLKCSSNVENVHACDTMLSRGISAGLFLSAFDMNN